MQHRMGILVIQTDGPECCAAETPRLLLGTIGMPKIACHLANKTAVWRETDNPCLSAKPMVAVRAIALTRAVGQPIRSTLPGKILP